MTGSTVDREVRQDVAEVLVRYATSIDSRDWALFRSCFTADCQADYGPLGSWQDVDSFANFMEELHAPIGQTLHRITNQVVTPNAEGVRARSYFDTIAMTADGKQLRSHGIGYYDDDLVRTEDGWKISRRRPTMVHVRRDVAGIKQ